MWRSMQLMGPTLVLQPKVDVNTSQKTVASAAQKMN